MKKLYFLLLFLMFAIGNAQPLLVTDYTLCDDDTDGITQFDLTSKNAEILANLNPNEHTLSYYETLSGAQSGIGSLTFPSAYTNSTPGQQTIFARVTNTQTSESSYYYFNLIVNPRPTGNPAILTYCDPMELPIFNLNMAIPQIIGNQQNLMVVFFDSLVGGNVIPNGIFSPTQFPTQVIGAVVTDAFGCLSERIPVTLTVCTGQQTCPAPSAISIAAATITETALMINWNQPAGVAYSQLYMSTSPTPPTPNTAPTAWVQSVPYIASGLTPSTCYYIFVRSACSPGATSTFSDWVGPMQACTFNCENNGQCADNLALVAFLDTNNNGIKDNGEAPFEIGMFAYEINDSGNIIYANSNNLGTFHIFDNNPNNTYDLNFTVDSTLSAYYSASATYSNINIPAGGGNHTYYFPVTQLQSYKDLEIQIIPSGAPRPGFTYTNLITFKNKGAESIPSGTITFTKDNAVSIINVNPNTQTDMATGFTFNFSNLAVNEIRTVQVTMQVPTIPTVSLGQMLTNSAVIIPVVDDAFPLNNSASITQNIVGSYDPNDKTEKHGGKIALDTFTTDDYLTYTIQFENTGTASAEFIRVEDLLDTGLDAASVVMLNASHPYNMRRINNNLVWNFYDVNLSPTMTNPTQSHGFIQFKVKPTAGYVVGTTIPNAASIYFDFNPPIITEPFVTEFVETLAADTFANSTFFMYPNPAKTFVHVGLKDSSESIASITIRDVLGKSVKVVDVQSHETAVDISRLSKGIYFMEITIKNNLKQIRKLVVE